MKILYAYFDNSMIGEIYSDEDERLSFSYVDSWLEDKKSFPLSFALPLKKGTFSHLETRSFFENLLPEGEVRKRIEKQNRLPTKNDYDFLKHYGRDCAGAIAVTEDPDYHRNIDQEGMIHLPFEEIYEALRVRKHIAEHISEKNRGYLSLAGAQDKFPAIYKEGEIFLPTHGAPTTHIFKTPIMTYKSTEDSIYNEYFCMKLAKRVGFESPEVDIINGEYPLYMVERFDRTFERGAIQRIHQQDFCQAQGIPSGRKYEVQGGPTLIDDFKLIKKYSSNKIKDLEIFLKWISFNLIIGNNDSHSKNISFLYLGNKNILSPIYDLVATAIYPEIQSEFAFRIGDKTLWQNLKKDDFLSTERGLGVRPGYFLKTFENMALLIERSLEEEREDFNSSFKGVKTASKIAREIEKRIQHFRYKNIF